MWKPYRSVKKKFFKNSIHILDKYHFIRQVILAVENVRKEIHKKLNKKERIYFKRNKSLFSKNQLDLTNEEKEQLSITLERSEELRQAYITKESFNCYVMRS